MSGKQITGDEGSGELEDFRRRLRETIVWCGTHKAESEPASCLRTPALRPPILNGDEHYPWGTPHERHEIVVRLAAVRSHMLGSLSASDAGAIWGTARGSSERSAGGKLLAFDPDHSLSDGAAWAASDGFFDSDNAPAWDTWVRYVAGPENEGRHPFNSYLLAWIPAWLVDRVSYAIEVNPEECIMWATELERPFIRRLRAAHLAS